MNIRLYLTILLARYKLILSIFLVIVASVTALSLVMPKTYTATAMVLLDVKTADQVAGGSLGSVLPPQVLQSYMATQIEIISSERTALKVVKALKLEQDMAARQGWMKHTGGATAFDGWLAAGVLSGLKVAPSGESNIIAITYASSQPKQSAQLANAIAEAYIRTDLELKLQPARQSAEFFDARTKAFRDQLEQAQAKLASFQKENGIVASGQVDLEMTKLTDLSTRLATMQAAVYESASRRQSGSGSPENLAEAAADPVIQGLRADLARQESQFRQISGRYGVNHPEYIRARIDIDSTRERIRQEAARVARTLEANVTANQRQEGSLRGALETQKARVLKLNEQRLELAVLQRDVESAQRAYDAILQRQAQTSLESKSEQTNLRLIAPAVEPFRPSKPNIPFNIALAVFLGMGLGVAAALALEILDSRVRDVDDFAGKLGLPVLGVVGGAPDTPFQPLLTGPTRLVSRLRLLRAKGETP